MTDVNAGSSIDTGKAWSQCIPESSFCKCEENSRVLDCTGMCTRKHVLYKEVFF